MVRCLAVLSLAGLLVTVELSGAPVAALPQRTDALGDPLPTHALLRIGTVRFRHGDVVTALAVFPDGNRVASAGRDNTIRIWDLANGKELRRWTAEQDPGPAADVVMLALAGNGKRLASGSSNEKIKLWDPDTGRLQRTLDVRCGSNGFLTFLDDDTLLVHRDRGVCLVNAATGEEVRSFRLEESDENRPRREKDDLASYALSKDGSLLLTGQLTGSVRLWDVAVGKMLARFDDDYAVSAAALSVDNQVLAWGTTRGKISIAKLAGEEPKEFAPDGTHRIDAIAFSPDGKHVASGSGGGIVSIIATDTGKECRHIQAHNDGVTCLAYAPDGNLIVTGGYDGCLRIWDADSGKEKPPTHESRGRVFVALAPDGSRLATATPDQAVCCYDSASGRQLQSFPVSADYVSCSLLFSAEGDRLSALMAGTLRSWDIDAGRELQHLHLGREFERGLLSPDGRVVIGRGGTPNLNFYRLTTNRSVRIPVTKLADAPYRFATSADSRIIGALRNSGMVQFWDAATAKEVAHLQVPPHVFNFALTPDKELVVTLAAKPPKEQAAERIGRWVLSASTPLPPFQGDLGEPVSLAVSPDGKTLITGDDAGPLRVWELATGSSRGILRGHQGAVVSLAFSADGKRLLSGSRDTTALLWDLSSVARGEQALPMELGDRDLDALWTDLRSRDGVTAYRAVNLLTTFPKRSVPFLGEHLQAAAVDDRRINRLIADLDRPEFEKRQAAHGDLLDMAGLAEPALRKALQNPPSAEVRRHLEELLEQGKVQRFVLTGDRLRTWRALEVLEACNTADARQVLGHLSQGAESDRVTAEAKLALARLRKR